MLLDQASCDVLIGSVELAQAKQYQVDVRPIITDSIEGNDDMWWESMCHFIRPLGVEVF